MRRERPIEVVLTAHNEEGDDRENDPRVRRPRPTCHALDVDVLVAEDGSSDRTREVVAGIAERSRGRVRLTPPAAAEGLQPRRCGCISSDATRRRRVLRR